MQVLSRCAYYSRIGGLGLGALWLSCISGGMAVGEGAHCLLEEVMVVSSDVYGKGCGGRYYYWATFKIRALGHAARLIG